jgi:hypothetical protein
MLSISLPIKGAGREDYYLELAREDYYTGGSEPPGSGTEREPTSLVLMVR